MDLSPFNLRLLRSSYNGNRRKIVRDILKHKGPCVLSMWGYGVWHVGNVTTFDPEPLLQVRFNDASKVTMNILDDTVEPVLGQIGYKCETPLSVAEFGTTKDWIKV